MKLRVKSNSWRLSAKPSSVENDTAKLEQIGKELSELKEQESSYKAKWQSEKALVNKIQQNKVEIENLKFEADKAEREGDYGKVAEIRYGKLQALNKEIEETQQKLHQMQGDKAMIKEEVDAEDIADVVSRWTGIPVNKMLQSEREKLPPLGRRAAQTRHRAGRSHRSRGRCRVAAAGPDCKTQSGLSARSSSWAPRVSARRNWPKHWRNSSSTTNR